MKSLHIALVYTESEARLEGRRLYTTEFERAQDPAVRAIANVLVAMGHQMHAIPAGIDLPARLERARPDLVFNLSTGIEGGSAQTFVPVILEAMHIPYTGSGVLAHALALDKAKAKVVFAHYGLYTAPFQVMLHEDEPLDPRVGFPAIVKPVREGSSIGIDSGAFVQNEEALRTRVRWVLQTLQEPALVERYIFGREFTVGVLGNAPPQTLPILERKFIFQNEQAFIRPCAVHKECPADLPSEITEKIAQAAVTAYRAIGCADYARVDLILEQPTMTPYLLEINSLPGLKPEYSDLPFMAERAGLGYAGLIESIISHAAYRWGIWE